MAVILTNAERDALLKEPKKPVHEVSTVILKKKSQMKYKEFEVDLIDSLGRNYKMVIRKSTDDIFDFSIILRYHHQEAKTWRTLTRYNGFHGIHKNVLEKESIEDFHIHKITEKYQNADRKEDGYAEITKSYDTYDAALKEFLTNNNIGQINFNASLLG